ncbi:MAG: hypothetical protein H7338_12840 [Candidatus Sericytochromatia bacterium]|nr:hypothetical protein [Candidatus Sericytochromatia bacterium]
MRVGPLEGFRIVPGQPQLVGWPVDLDERSDWGVVVSAYGNTEQRKVVALGVRAGDVIHLMRWSAIEMDSERQRLRLSPATSWREREPFLDEVDGPPD